MAATSEEEQKKRLLTLQPNTAQILPQFQQTGLGDLLALMAAQRANAPAVPGATAPKTTAPPATTTATAAVAPAAGQSDLSALLSFMSQQQKGFDPVAAQTAIRNTPVADYQAQRQIATSQAAEAGLAATSAEDAVMNRAIARNRVSEQFGGPPALGETFSKLLPDQDSTLTAFPSGGYAVTGTATGRDAEVAARKANYKENIAQTSAGRETRRRAELMSKPGFSPLDYGAYSPTTAELEARNAIINPTPNRQLARLTATAAQRSLVPFGRGYKVGRTPITDAEIRQARGRRRV